MSFKRGIIHPCSPTTTRGESTKISSNQDKIVYTNGKAVIIRDLKDPAISIVYSGHVQPATAARIAPSGFYCASGDATGTVKVWDTLGEENVLKAEYKIISGKIKDLEWDGESKRIVAVGDGREKFGHAFMMETGSSTGEIMGHSKTINAVSIRHQRPFRAATASDDSSIVFFQGVPFKFDKTIRTHTKFVQDVRFSPSGDHFASVGSDYKIFLYDGKTGDTIGEFNDSPHTGSINACSFSPDSKSLVTSSGDRTVKLWDVETKKSQVTWTVGTGLNHQQVGNTWTAGEHIVSLSLSGELNVFDKRVDDKPTRILSAPQKAITSGAKVHEASTFVVGTADGRVLSFSDDYEPIVGEAHASLVSGISVSPSGTVHSVGYDDRLREFEGNNYTPAAFSTATQPKGLAVSADSTVFIAEVSSVEAVRSNQKIFDLALKYTPSAIAATGSIVAVGGEDQKVRLYTWDGKTLTESTTLEGNKSVVSALAFSSDGSLLASGDSTGKIVLFDIKERKTITSRWAFHSARIHSLSWTADGRHCASGSLDTHVYVWSVEKPMKNIAVKNANPGGVNVVFWLKEGELASAGADGCVRVWNITFHA